jgi:hypothetical protein
MSAWENREDGSTIYILYEDHTMRAVEELVFALRFDAPGGRSSATPVLDECVREFGFVRVPFDPGGPD